VSKKGIIHMMQSCDPDVEPGLSIMLQ